MCVEGSANATLWDAHFTKKCVLPVSGPNNREEPVFPYTRRTDQTPPRNAAVRNAVWEDVAIQWCDGAGALGQLLMH